MYIFAFIGKLGEAIFSQAATLTSLGFLLKAAWSLFIDLAGLIIYLVARKSGSNFFTAASLMCAYIFNPGILFESCVWGQCSTPMLFFIIVSALMITYDQPTLSFVFAALALLTKQISIYLVFILIVANLAKFGFKKSLNGILAMLLTFFILILPLTIVGYSPFFLINTALGFKVLNLLAEKPRQILWCPVSSFAFNIWPILTAFANNQSLLDRFNYPDYSPSPVPGWSYLRVATIVTISAILWVAFLTWISIRKNKQTHYLALFLVSLIVYTFFTRMHERYMSPAIPMIILAFLYLKLSKKVFVALYSLSTVIYFVAMYFVFILTALWVPGMLPLFDPESNWLANIIYSVLFTDSAITLMCIIEVIGFVFAFFYFHKITSCVSLVSAFKYKILKRKRF